MQMSVLFKGSYCAEAKPDTPFPHPLSLSLPTVVPPSRKKEKFLKHITGEASQQRQNVIEKQKRTWTQSCIMWLLRKKKKEEKKMAWCCNRLLNKVFLSPGPLYFSPKCRKHVYRLYHHTRDCTIPACKPHSTPTGETALFVSPTANRSQANLSFRPLFSLSLSLFSQTSRDVQGFSRD